VIKIFLEATEEELVLSKITEMGKILSDLTHKKEQNHNILAAHKGEQFS
jgi:hypothetical protein